MWKKHLPVWDVGDNKMCEEDDGDSGKLGKEMERAEGMCTNGS